MASGIYDVFKEDMMDGSINIDTGGDTIKIALMDNSHPTASGDLQSDATWADVSANEIDNTSGSSYTEGGGETLAGQVVAVSSGTASFDATDQQWTSATFSAWHAVLYDTTNADSLICTIDLGGEQTVSAGTFTIQWNASGIITLS